MTEKWLADAFSALETASPDAALELPSEIRRAGDRRRRRRHAVAATGLLAALAGGAAIANAVESPFRTADLVPAGTPTPSVEASSPSPSSTPPSARPPATLRPTTASGGVTLQDPLWGALTVLTTVDGHDSSSRSSCGHDVRLRLVDARGVVRLHREWTWGCGTLRPNGPVTDRTGNVFLQYDPGRYDGVIVLRGAGGRIEDFGTLPPSGSAYQGSGPFGYYASTKDKGRDGVLEVEQYSNDCNPSCAGGTITSKVFVWNGTRYVQGGPSAR